MRRVAKIGKKIATLVGAVVILIGLIIGVSFWRGAFSQLSGDVHTIGEVQQYGASFVSQYLHESGIKFDKELLTVVYGDVGEDHIAYYDKRIEVHFNESVNGWFVTKVIEDGKEVK